MKKLFPPHLSQMVFLNLDGEIEKINGLDYDILVWLIYQTHKARSLSGDDFITLEYSELKKSVKTKSSVRSIKAALQKINQIQLYSNYLCSYGDKNPILTTQPFEIELIEASNGKSYGFGVRASKCFLSWFDNPKVNVEVNYELIFGLKKMSKLLYLFLKDSLGIYSKKPRTVDLPRLRNMMNVCNVDATNTNFITQLKRALSDINEKSDIKVECEVKRKRDLRTGLSEAVAVRFVIQKDEVKPEEQSDTKTSAETVGDSSRAKPTTAPQPVSSATSDMTFDQYIDQLVKTDYERQIAAGTDVKSPGAYRKKIRDTLKNDPTTRPKFELETMLSSVKSELRGRINGLQPHKLVLTDGRFPTTQMYYLNTDYCFVSSYDSQVVTDNVAETLAFIKQHNGKSLHFDAAVAIDLTKESVGLL